jgi:hypothetical protein
MNILTLYPRAVISKTNEEKNNIKETHIKIQLLKQKYITALVSLLQGSNHALFTI